MRCGLVGNPGKTSEVHSLRVHGRLLSEMWNRWKSVDDCLLCARKKLIGIVFLLYVGIFVFYTGLQRMESKIKTLSIWLFIPLYDTCQIPMRNENNVTANQKTFHSLLISRAVKWVKYYRQQNITELFSTVSVMSYQLFIRVCYIFSESDTITFDQNAP